MKEEFSIRMVDADRDAIEAREMGLRGGRGIRFYISGDNPEAHLDPNQVRDFARALLSWVDGLDPRDEEGGS
jgi:hypothetical protein